MTVYFVSRQALPEPGAIPGLGPKHRSATPGGRLMAWTGVGEPTDLFKYDRPGFRDASDPSASPGGMRFSWVTVAAPGEGWRITTKSRESSGVIMVEPEFVPGADVPYPYDDLDPCWLDDSTLVFASTRDGWRSQYDGTPVTQIYRFDCRDGRLTRLTSERNGAEEPCRDPRTGRIVYSRWWFNRAIADSASHDTVNVWQAVSIARDGSDSRVVGVVPGERRLSSLYQVAISGDGSVFGVVGDALGLSPSPGATELTRRGHAAAPPVHIAGARFDPEETPRYGSTRGLASPSACSPAVLPDGRVIYSLDPGGRGDYGLWIADRDGANARPLLDLPGTLELDAVVWTAKPMKGDGGSSSRAPEPTQTPFATPGSVEALASWPHRFRFLNRNVFGAGFGTKEAATARAAGPVRIRFWAALPRRDSPHGDTLVLVREAPVSRNGRVDERDLPASVPMFEQLIGADGRVLRSGHGPTHVAGYNAGVPGKTSSCIGCHRGHSLAR